MLKSDANILFPIGEGENHQAVEVVNLSEQKVVDSVGRVNAGQFTDFSDALAREFGVRFAVKEDNIVPIPPRQRGDDTGIGFQLSTDGSRL